MVAPLLLKVRQIKPRLRELFEPHLDLSDLSANDPERDTKLLSRCLAAFAVLHETGCSPKEAAASVWDGADDNGIDAAYFDSSESCVVLVQSKWIERGTGEPPAADIGTFVRGVRDVVENTEANFSPRITARLRAIAQHIVSVGTKLRLAIVTTGGSTFAIHGTRLLDSLLEELNGDDPDPFASTVIVGLSEVYSGLASDPANGRADLQATIQNWVKISDPIPAYVGTIDGLQLKRWWQQYGKRAVAGNIRFGLGSTDVNRDIKTTAENQPEHFWYFNNGVTVVANEAIRAPRGATTHAVSTFVLRNASIVNGAQTVSSLAKVENEENLANVLVSIRIILLKTAPEGFGATVTRTNNLQNRIELRDFTSHDPEQFRLREEMGIEGVGYQFVRSEEAASGPTSCELLEVTNALACASGDAALAVMVKSGIGRVFADLDRGPYRILFNPSISGAKAFNSVLLLRTVDDWIRQRADMLTRRSGNTWGALVHGNRILAAAVFKRFGLSNLSVPIAEFRGRLDRDRVVALCEEVLKTMIQVIEEQHGGKVLALVFKSNIASQAIFNAIAEGPLQTELPLTLPQS